MKPSEIIQKKSLELIEKNKGLQELKGMPDNETKVQFITQIGCAIQIQAIIDYLDEEYEAQEQARQELINQKPSSTVELV